MPDRVEEGRPDGHLMGVTSAHRAAILFLNELTDIELLALTMAVELGQDPRDYYGYEKVKPLFTEDIDGVPRVHDLTREAFALAVQKRFGGGCG